MASWVSGAVEELEHVALSRAFLYAIIAGLALFGAVMTGLFYSQGAVLDSTLRCVMTAGTWA